MNLLFPDFIADGLSGQGTFFKDNIAKFCNETGAKATMTAKAFPTAYREELELDLDTGLNFYDAFNFFGSWMPGLVVKGHLMQLTEYVQSAASINWADMLPAIRRGVAEFQNEVYMLPADGDVIVMIYRKDLLDLHGLSKPETWEDWLAVSKYFRENVGASAWVDSPNRTLHQEGGYGACMMTKRNDWAYANLFAFLATYLQAQGPTQGIFFDPQTMEPLFNTPAVREALLLYKEIVLHSSHSERPCTECTDDGGAGLFTMVEDMQKGKCMMGFNYMGPVKFIASGAFNTANNTIALSQVPGSTRVKSVDGGSVVSCDTKASNCLYATESMERDSDGRLKPGGTPRRVNRATYYSGGGQSWAISGHVKDQKKRDALWELLLGFVSTENAILSTAAADYLLDPFRQTTLDGLQVKGHLATEKFMQNGWKWEQLGTMKETLQTVFTDPNSALDLKIVQGGSYIEETDEPMLKYFKGELTVDEVIEDLTGRWKARTEAIGRQEQRNLYRSVLGLGPIFDRPNCSAGTQNLLGRCEPCSAGTAKDDIGPHECPRCPAGLFQDETGKSDCKACNDILADSTTQFMGSMVRSDCVCDQGSYHENGICLQCSAGMLCDEFDQQLPKQDEGFKVEGDAAQVNRTIDYIVYRCLDVSKCPAGQRGQCSAGHTGVACATCLDGYHMVPASGQCSKCEASSSYPTAIVAIIAGLVGLVFLTYAVNRDPITRSHAALSCVISAGILVSAVQTLGVFSQLSIKWFEPAKTIMRVMPLLSFDPRSFKVGCLVGASPLSSYATQLAIAPMCAALILTIIAIKHRSIKATTVWVEFVNTVGTIFKVLFISLVMSTFAPVVCYSHPDGQHQSMRSNPSVLCFESPEHSWMFGLGMVVFLLVPAPFFAAACYCTWLFPRKTARVSADSALYLNATRFFFAKFEPTKYYYGLCMLMRSLAICFVPVIIRDNLPLQVVFIGLIIGAIHIVQTQTMPWRVPLNNTIDTSINVGMWMLMMVGAMCVGLSADLESIRVVGTALFLVSMALAFSSLLASGSKMFRGGTFYHYFICHDRSHAAAQARLLKIMLQSKTGKAVHIDSDDFTELDGLLDIVKSRVGTLLAYLTRATLSKPWCAAEITVGVMTTKCKVLAVQTPSFQPPDEDELSDLNSYLDLQSCNFEHYGITTAHVQTAFTRLLSGTSVVTIDMPASAIGTRKFEVLSEMIDTHVKSKLGEASEAPKLQAKQMRSALVVISDERCDEANAVVCLLKTKMQVALEGVAQGGICCLCDYQETGVALDALTSARGAIVLLSSGTLASPVQLAIAAWATKLRGESGNPDVIPVSIPGFVFPVEEFFADTAPEMFRSATGVKFGFSEASEFVQSLREFFWSTRTSLSPQSSERMLDQEVQDLLARLRRGPRRSTISRATVARLSSSRLSKEGRLSKDSKGSDVGMATVKSDPLTVMV